MDTENHDLTAAEVHGGEIFVGTSTEAGKPELSLTKCWRLIVDNSES